MSEVKPTTGKTVLLVEDNPHNRKIFSGMLAHAGFAVVEAEDGHQALAAIAKKLPDVILMDLSIPGVDGWRPAWAHLLADREVTVRWTGTNKDG